MNSKKNRRKITAALASFFLALFFCLPTFATANELHSLEVTVLLNEDGSANITEVWDMTNTEGTEVYKEMKNMEGSQIHSLSVKEKGKKFKTLPDWDIDASREEKKYKAGIIQDGDDYELCFGIGDYGSHVYTMSYVVDSFVEKYDDMYGMNYRLVNEGMNTVPEKVSVIIKSDQITEDTLVYGFGFEGTVYVEGGPDEYYIDANNDLDGSYGQVQYVNILAGFSGATFTNANDKHSDRTFEDMAEEAKEGSSYEDDYEEESGIGKGIMGAIAGVFLLLVGGLFVVGYKENQPKFTDGNNKLPKEKEVDYFRDIPANRDPFLFYYIVKKRNLANRTSYESGILAAMLLSWVRDKKIAFSTQRQQGMFKSKERVAFHFINNNPTFRTPMETKLYSYFKAAAGNNQILENEEFERWCKKNYTKIDDWFSSIEGQVEAMMTNNGYMEGVRIKNKPKLIYTPKYREEILHSMGFKKFIKEFSRLGEKQVKEVVLWEDYLIFASVLGMADNVEKEIGRLYPGFTNDSSIDPYFMMMATRAFAYDGIRSVEKARSANSGGGGSSSFSGGGSSFSGGGGGGTR
ncbi:MAG TPA: DUF2207 domain-containing protein [Candidatus Dorea intestinavium]|nr:DUF2207 domain-containing protein [Candidatus Dorea intestinavium]